MQAIAAAGVTSRRGADELIFQGKVKVNGQVVIEPGTQVDLRKDKVGGQKANCSGSGLSSFLAGPAQHAGHLLVASWSRCIKQLMR